MVAYNFQRRFAPRILDGSKIGTVRADRRRRHAQPGDTLQLYCGMRTRRCDLIAEKPCAAVERIGIDFQNYPYVLLRAPNGAHEAPASDAFAQADGFANFTELAGFFLRQYADEDAAGGFSGVWIRWAEPPWRRGY